jgi:hypothetical protein
LVIIIIIIIGKRALFEPSLEVSARFDPVFTSLDFVNNFFTQQGHQPCIQPPTWSTGSLYLCPPVTGWPGYTPRHWVPPLLPSTIHRATVEVR